MTLAITFLLTFIAGPAAFWVLARQRPAPRYILMLCAAAIAFIGLAYAISLWLMPRLPDTPFGGLLAIMTLWFAWIVVLAVCTLAVRAQSLSPRNHRLAFSLGAVATTLPWFGLVTAQMIAG